MYKQKNDKPTDDFKIALLIDGDNAQPKLLEYIFEEVAKKGLITIRRIYGDWTKPEMNSWKELLNTNAIQPFQQFRYTTGKNATDSAMIIDAMDILHARLVDGFCIVSSDSDYTRLATRIREDGLLVMGIGEKKTPEPFVKACEIFIYTENLIKGAELQGLNAKRKTKSSKTTKEKKLSSNTKLMKLLKKAYFMVILDNETAYLGDIGQALRKLDSGFDPRAYGVNTLLSLFKALSDVFEIIPKDDGNSIYIKMKSK